MTYFSTMLLGSVLLASSSAALAEGLVTPPRLPSDEPAPVVANLPASLLDDVGRDIMVINNSNRQVCVAIVEASPLKARGWYTLANGEDMTFYNLSYIHAEECGQTGVSWNPPWDLRYLCLNPTQAFDYYTPDNATMCDMLGGTMASYFRIPAGTDVYNWTLTY